MPAIRLPRLRHLLVRHRRWIAGLCAFLAVLLGLSALQPRPLPAASVAAGASPSVRGPVVASGMVAAPVRLADDDVADLLTVGDLVDVLAADGEGRAAVVADGVTVIEIPHRSDDGISGTGFDGALVLLAVTATEATQLAARSAVGPLSVVLRNR